MSDNSENFKWNPKNFKDWIFILVVGFGYPLFLIFVNNNVYDIFDSQLTISELFRILDVPFSLEDHETIAILLEMFLIAIIYGLICTYIFYGKRGLWLSTPLWLKRILNK